jgi:hypothetical protein
MLLLLLLLLLLRLCCCCCCCCACAAAANDCAATANDCAAAVRGSGRHCVRCRMDLWQIGFFKGDSMRLWRKVFPSAELHCIENYNEVKYEDNTILVQKEVGFEVRSAGCVSRGPGLR